MRNALAVLTAKTATSRRIGRTHVPRRRNIRRRIVRVELELNPDFRVVGREPSASTHNTKYVGRLPQLPTRDIPGRCSCVLVRAPILRSRRPRSGCIGQRDCVHLARRLEAVALPLGFPLLCSTPQRASHATSRGISSFDRSASMRHFPFPLTPPHANQRIGTSLRRYIR